MKRNRISSPLVMWMALIALIGVGWAAVSQTATHDAADAAANPRGNPADDHQAEAEAENNMPMRMSPQMMQRAHAGDDSAWAASGAGIFILRGGELLRYDPATLEVIAEAELPEEVSPPLGIEREDEPDEAEAEPRHRMHRMEQMWEQMEQRMQRMQQMMAEAQTALPTDLQVLDDAVYVVRNGHLLRYDHDLELQQAVTLPDAPEPAEP